MYADYCSKQTESALKENELRTKNMLYSQTIKICESDPSLKSENLASFLIKPVQRICKYPLFFRELLSNIPENTEAHRKVQEASEIIGEVVNHVNEERRRSENVLRMIEIERTTNGLPHVFDTVLLMYRL